MYASIEGFVEYVHLRRLTWASTAWICHEYKAHTILWYNFNVLSKWIYMYRTGFMAIV